MALLFYEQIAMPHLSIDYTNLIARAHTVLKIESDAVLALQSVINDNFLAAIELILTCKNRIIIIGMGKSGHIGCKIAATFASTGTPAFFVHPAEASHGDLGMIMRDDVVIALSNSGETDEILAIIPLLKRQNIPLISLTGNAESTLAKAAHVHLNVGVKEEACPLGLAPTASTTATLAMGDAIAVTLLEARGFTAEDFARSHPGGKLGRRLLLRVADIMANIEAIPALPQNTKLTDVLMAMTQKPVGMAVIVDTNHHVLGVFTEGDLRRALMQHADIHQTDIASCMTSNCSVISEDALAIDAVKIMETKKITAIPVIHNSVLVGVVNMHHLLNARVI